MNTVLCTLCLNEIEHLPSLYAQHRHWPGAVKWVFVEAADRVYAQTNPELVSPQGLSVDGTTEWLEELAKNDCRVTHIKHGFCGHADPAQGKIEARQRYLDEAAAVKPGFITVLDADEFYTYQMQREVYLLMGKHPNFLSYRFRQHDIWRPASIADNSLFDLEVRGGYWDVCHCRFFRWYHGLSYQINHNWPSLPTGAPCISSMKRFDRMRVHPEYVHLGFASIAKMRAAKNAYYVARGEGVTDHRQMYVDCRRAFETWMPGDKLPHGAVVQKYTGPIPEVFQEQSHVA